MTLPALAGLLLALGPGGCREQPSPAGPPAQVIAGMNRGVGLMGQYLYDDAAKAFEEVLTAAPHLAEARINLAIALFNRNRKEDLEAAEKLLASVLQKEPGNVRALYFQAILLQHLGKAEEAIPRLEAVVQQRADDGAAWYLLALCRQRVGQPAEADFLRAVQFRPYLYSAYYQLYQGAMRAGDEAKAQEYMNRFKALRASPLGETIELPQYNQMGDLALVRPVPAATLPPITKSQYRLQAAQSAVELPGGSGPAAQPSPWPAWGMAVGDLDRDGRPDLVIPAGSGAGPRLLLHKSAGVFTDATAGSGLEAVADLVSCAVGDVDHDEVPDLFIVGLQGSGLWKGKGDGTFQGAEASSGIAVAAGQARSALLLDADHDGDLDIFVCDALANRLWNNNGNGTFTNLADQVALACTNGASALVLPGDLDGDRDADLVVLRQGRPAKVFLNELLGRYREADGEGLDIRGDAGGVLQDVNGDGFLDLAVLGGEPRVLRLFLGDGHGRFRGDAGFDGAAAAAASWGELKGLRVADVDLDGDLDLVPFGAEVHLLLNDGSGRFVVQAQVWKPAPGALLVGLEVADMTGDLVPDLVVLERGTTMRLVVLGGELAPPSTAVALMPSGVRSRDGRTRSPASGFGVVLTARAGLREQRVLCAGQSGGPCQSLGPTVLGLGGAARADYVGLLWPDGVVQVELALAAGQVHAVAELQRKISSCPVLFTWNGRRYEFVTDFAGVGGLGYFSAPGVTAPPQVLEHVKIQPDQLRPRDGRYEIRVTEPMEEAAYIDRLALAAVDHPADWQVFPDERLALSGPAPTHELLVVREPIRPVRARDPAGRDCTGALQRVDRVYAYDPPRDRRYIGFCEPHTLELEFGRDLGGAGPAGRLFLFLNGYIEYPYSQTVYAAGQSRVGWEPIRIEGRRAGGDWEVLVPDGGVPGGMGRTMTIALGGAGLEGVSRLRLTTNLEVSYDEVFVACAGAADEVVTHSVPVADASLRYVGFAREHSPDGRLPLVYDYDLTEATAPFHTLKGAYTRYGDVAELLQAFDDRYVVMGPGDEIAVAFDARALPEVPPGHVRSFVLVSHAYCKDMDLYTATPRTLEPWPFKAMSGYPYPDPERFPDTPAWRRYLRTYNTRVVE